MLKSWAVALPVLLYLSGEQRTALLIGLVYFLIYLMTSQASRNAGRVQRLVGNSAAALNANYLLNTGIYLLAGIGFFLKIYPLVILAFLGIFLIQNFQKPIMVGYVGEVTDSKRMATVLSVENQSRAIAIALFAPVIGFLADRFTVGGGLIGYAVILLLLFPLAKIK